VPSRPTRSNFDGSTGFSPGGAAAFDQVGWSVASAGDVNGDGLTDLIAYVPQADPNGIGNSAASETIILPLLG
jgi:hypothetical protein